MGTPNAAPTALDSIVGNDGFWPDLPVRLAIETHRLQTDAREGALIRLLTDALIETNERLAAARARIEAAGYASLSLYAAAHPNDKIGGKPLVEGLYFSAVLDWAKATETRRRAGVQRQAPNGAEADGAMRIADDFLNSHQRAVARLLKRIAPDLPAVADAGVHVALI